MPTPPATPPHTSPRTIDAQDEGIATGDSPAVLQPPLPLPVPLPARPTSAAAVAAKHVNVDLDFGELAGRRNPFDVRFPGLGGVAAPHVRAHGARFEG